MNHFSEYNFDTFQIKNWEICEPEGFLKVWIVGGVPNYVLNYDGRKEIIYEDDLFDQSSLNTAVGMPIILNHPPQGIVNKDNYKNYLGGAVLQEFVKEPTTGALTMASIIYDPTLIDGIVNKKYTHVSSAYGAVKVPNQDGVLIQKNRNYNHFAILDERNLPRAGSNSKIFILENNTDNSMTQENTEKPAVETGGSDAVVTPAPQEPINEPVIPVTPNPTEETVTTTPETIETAPTSPPISPEPQQTDSSSNPNMIQIDSRELETRIELLTTWKPILEKNNKTVNFNSDSSEIKREVLSLYYTPQVLKQIDSTNIDGFWLGFITTNNDAQQVVGTSVLPKINADSENLNYDSTVDNLIQEFTKKMEGRK